MLKLLEKPQLVTTGEAVNFRDSWRVFKIIAEFVDGYNFVGDLKREVTILGSARLAPNNKYYKIAEQFGALLGKNGFTTMTGGGPGIMEAANKGADKAGGESVGINIQLPREQRTNPYVKKSVGFSYFFTRKVMLTSPANAFVLFPGGFGTLDEFFEVVDYMELGYMHKSPIVLVGREFWEPLIKFLRNQSVGQVHAFPEEIINTWHIVETAEEAFNAIKNTEDRDNICAVDDILCRGGADWRIFRILAELVDGFEFLSNVRGDVTVLGTKSILPGSSYYDAAYELGKALAKNGNTVVTGGGPGTMEAANKGAFEAGGTSIGINIITDRGERINNFVNKSLGFHFPFVRKLIITAPSEAFAFFPGGFGTLHQLFELLTLIETKKREPMPILLYGEEFWAPMLEYFRLLSEKFKTINRVDEDLVTVLHQPEDILKYLR